MSATAPSEKKPLGFWACWSLTVGIMIGSGIFLLPSALVPYGMISFAGWVLPGFGSIGMAFIVARLARRTTRSGGVYTYARDAFGDLTGFLIAWGYWAAYWIALPAIAIAFVGYLGVFIPALNDAPGRQAIVALALIWTTTIINIKGLQAATIVQLVMTLLKLVPLAIIIGLAAVSGEAANLPEFNPKDGSVPAMLATSALLTMWAFSGLEAGTMPAADVKNPETTVPRAIVVGTLTVTFVYIASTLAVMALVPAEILATSTSPFADAARGLGEWGPGLIAIGAMISTFGALNGCMFIAGQVPIAVALDGLASRKFAGKNRGGAPTLSLLLSTICASLLLMANYTQGLVALFTFLAMMSTIAVLVPLFVSALAEFRISWKSAKAWSGLAGLTLLYTIFTILGSGLTVIAWGLVLFAAGIPVYYFGREKI